METKRFVDLLERAYMALHSNENTMITVQFDPDPNDATVAPKSCLGLLVNAGEHMAEIAAKAMHLLWEDMQLDDDAEIDEAMNDFVTLMGTMKVAPYMQWHVAYFEWASDEEGDRNTTEVLGNGSPVAIELPDMTDEARGMINDVLLGLQEKIVDMPTAIAYIEHNPSLVAEMAAEHGVDTAVQHIINHSGA